MDYPKIPRPVLVSPTVLSRRSVFPVQQSGFNPVFNWNMKAHQHSEPGTLQVDRCFELCAGHDLEMHCQDLRLSKNIATTLPSDQLITPGHTFTLLLWVSSNSIIVLVLWWSVQSNRQTLF